MDQKLALDQLDDRTVLLILSYLTQELREELPESEAEAVRSQSDAQRLIAETWVESGSDPSKAEVFANVPSDENAASAARQVLTLLAQDETVRQRIEALVANPPKDEQMSVELAIAGAIVLGVVVSWLQTKVKISYSREKGETKFKVDIQKTPTDVDVIKNVVKSVMTLFTTTP